MIKKQDLPFQRVFLSSDHRGFPLKEAVFEYLKSRRYSFGIKGIINFGTWNEKTRVDYPIYASITAKSIQEPNVCGILICGSGIGMSIMANRYKHVRAALCPSVEHAKIGRDHSNANVLVLGADYLRKEEAIEIVKTFLISKFNKKYAQRINMLAEDSFLLNRC